MLLKEVYDIIEALKKIIQCSEIILRLLEC